MSMTQRYAGMLRRHAGDWDKRDMPVQAECCRQAARHMETRELDQRFVGLSTAIAEKDPARAGVADDFSHQRGRQGAELLVVRQHGPPAALARTPEAPELQALARRVAA